MPSCCSGPSPRKWLRTSRESDTVTSASVAFWLGNGMVVHQAYYPLDRKELIRMVRTTAMNWKAKAYVVKYNGSTEMYELKGSRWYKF